MTDKDMKFEAMLHLESGLEVLGDMAVLLGSIAHTKNATTPAEQDEIERMLTEVDSRIWAALYLTQAMQHGSRPENFDKVLNDARAIDAENEAAEVIQRAINGESEWEQ